MNSAAKKQINLSFHAKPLTQELLNALITLI